MKADPCISGILKFSYLEARRINKIACPAKEGWPGVKVTPGKATANYFFVLLPAGVELTGTSFSEITTTISKITFEHSDSHYKPGIPFFGQVGKQSSSAKL